MGAKVAAPEVRVGLVVNLLTTSRHLEPARRIEDSTPCPKVILACPEVEYIVATATCRENCKKSDGRASSAPALGRMISRTPIPLISKPSIISPTPRTQDLGTASAFSWTAMAPSSMPKKPFRLDGRRLIFGI
ncbi:hypothetical protein FS749_005856 [Ceratobasidium sp. UAMH 11750]|nr:hypothetical protein FS749_005856 [Ceratobasidium sp. UAMH 11750]